MHRYVVLRTAADPLAPDSEPASGNFDRGGEGCSEAVTTVAVAAENIVNMNMSCWISVPKAPRPWWMSLSGMIFSPLLVDDPDAGYWLIVTMWHLTLAARHQFQLPPSRQLQNARSRMCQRRGEAHTATGWALRDGLQDSSKTGHMAARTWR